MAHPPSAVVSCRRYCYVRADLVAPDTLCFVSAIVSVVPAAHLVTEDDWHLAALDAGHDAVEPPSADVLWNDTVVQL